MPPNTPPSIETEKILDWVFKVTTALIIPTLVWSFKMSNQITKLQSDLENTMTVSQIERKHLTERLSQQGLLISKLVDLKSDVATQKTKIEGIDKELENVSKSLEKINDLLIRYIGRSQ